MQHIPAFVRSIIVRAVFESWCEKTGVLVVTAMVLEEIRAGMPTPKVLGAGADLRGTLGK
jgi:hypothetical protein